LRVAPACVLEGPVAREERGAVEAGRIARARGERAALRWQQHRVAVRLEELERARLEAADDLLCLAGDRAAEAERDVLARRHPDAELFALRLGEAEAEAAGDRHQVGRADVMARADDASRERLLCTDGAGEHAIADL